MRETTTAVGDQGVELQMVVDDGHVDGVAIIAAQAHAADAAQCPDQGAAEHRADLAEFSGMAYRRRSHPRRRRGGKKSKLFGRAHALESDFFTAKIKYSSL